ncbi:MAG: glycosyltransferase family 4 protein [Bacteroidota bacterium]|nr:glycosyltransferase family 4 protein [Bacteroidota bacterium]
MRKILILTHNFYPFLGGIETVSEILANFFHYQGHLVHVLTWEKDKGEKDFPFKVIRNPSIKNLLNEHYWADIIVENNPCLRLSWPAILFRRKHCVIIQTWITRTNEKVGFIDNLKRKWLRKANSVIACSEAIQKGCWPSATVIRNPYSETVFKKMTDVVPTKDFVFVGRLVSDKGADLAVKALYELQEKTNTQFRLTVIGDGPEKESLRNLVMELQLEDSVHFTGKLEAKEIAKFLNQHKYLLVPSVWKEPFGIVALEGLACGCLPIVSDGGGLPEAIGPAGLTFKRNNLNSLVATIEHILTHPEEEEMMREAATEHLKNYTEKIVTRKYLQVIEGIAD